MLVCCCESSKRHGRKSEEIEPISSGESESGSESDSQEWAYEEHEWDSMYFGGLCCPPAEPSANAPIKSLRSKTFRMSPSFRDEYNFVPTPERPKSDPQHLVIDQEAAPELSLERLREVLEEREVVEGYLKEFSEAYNIKFDGWFDTPGAGELRACRARFTMPVPQEVPAAIARLVAVPEASAATMVLTHTSSGDDEELVMLQQVTHDVPFGANFRVHEAISFRRDASGNGITMSKWTTIKWIKDLPWHVSMIRPITESKTMGKSPEGGKAFLKVLRSLAQ